MALLIRGGTVVNADLSRRADVLVEQPTEMPLANTEPASESIGLSRLQ